MRRLIAVWIILYRTYKTIRIIKKTIQVAKPRFTQNSTPVIFEKKAHRCIKIEVVVETAIPPLCID